MTISEAAARSGLSVHAIRFYEARGVMPRTTRRSGARRFSDADIRALFWIARAREAHLSLDDISATVGSETTPRERGATLVRRMIALDLRRAELAAMLADVERLRDETRAALDALASPIGVRVSTS